jgi:hypothetical protein
MKDFLQIAPCGMNCSLCIAYQRAKNKCSGCNGPDENKPKSCTVCHIKQCEELLHTQSGFCFSCGKFPCKRLKQLDTRYRTKYGMSMIQNLSKIELQGMKNFIKADTSKWTCKKCGSLLSVHREQCQTCGKSSNKYLGKTEREFRRKVFP